MYGRDVKFSSVASAVAAIGLVGLGAWGLVSAQSVETLRTELSTQADIATTLDRMKASTDQTELTELLDSQLHQLPQSALSLSENSAPETEAVSLDQGVEKIFATSTQSAANTQARIQGVEFSQELWEFGVDHQMVKGTPPFIAESHATCQNPPDDAPAAPASVEAFMGSADAYLYTAEVLNARGNGYEKTLTEAKQWEHNISTSIACDYQVPLQYPAYAFEEKKPTESLKAQRKALLEQAEAVLADVSVPSDSAIFARAASLVFTTS